MNADIHESCLGMNELRYSLIKTSTQKRASWVESCIKSWNDQQDSEDVKIIFHSAELQPNIVTFTKNPWERMEDHVITKTIRSQQGVEDSTYVSWTSESLSDEELEGCREQKQRVKSARRQRVDESKPRVKMAKHAPRENPVMDASHAASLITALNAALAAKDKTIAAKDETIAAKDSVIAAKDETIRVMGSLMNHV